MTTLIEASQEGQPAAVRATAELRVAGHRPKPGVYYVVNDHDGDASLTARLMRLPPQGRVCYGILREFAGRMSEEEAMQMIVENGAKLRSKQDPWRIFQFYRPKLVDAGLLSVEVSF